ncbi:gibberellic acid methyltransferase 2 isoform X2 [Cinnamomum micranthum f. kanehirae]|uniref:Gibberellic acid methyltransferase 2 isoform X2 n=1 Tax=Cinnamomum micranthum f. kanehirae TaxID=337451 RepID=A0A443NM76_9MAGN|nr:gibberellic acid methyltransferase 2 isoform X2 [Cinnamomum micranthum f. kanehirae]
MDSQRLMPASSIKESRDFKNTKECRSWSWTGDLHRILCMQGGEDDVSYAKNSDGPAAALGLSKPLLMEAIQSMKLFKGEASLRIADLGCATGYNTLTTVELLVDRLSERYYEECDGVPEFEAFFSDLPSNDFNTLFRSLPTLYGSTRQHYYAAGVPGSFYHRLFPKRKLHIAVSLSALHWLSQIPKPVLDNTSLAWNKGRAWIDGAKEEVVEAYAKQSEEDLISFLQCRREEIVEGGILFILMAGRPGSLHPEHQLGDPDSRAKHPFTSSMDQAWEDLLNEGLVDEERRDTFNIPAYMRSPDEVRKAFEQCTGFEIRTLEYRKIVEHSKEKQEEWIKDPVSYGRAKANLVRASLKPIIEAHLGPKLSEELFKRYEKRASGDTEMLHKTCFYGVIIVCAVRI